MYVFDINDLNPTIKSSLEKKGFVYLPVCEIDAFRRQILWFSGAVCLVCKGRFVSVLEANEDSEYLFEAGQFSYRLHNSRGNQYFKKVLQCYVVNDEELIRLMNGNSKGMKLTCKVPAKFTCSFYETTDKPMKNAPRFSNCVEFRKSYKLRCVDVVEAIRDSLFLFESFLNEKVEEV